MIKKSTEKFLGVFLAKAIKEEVASQLAAQKKPDKEHYAKPKLLTQKELTEELSLSIATLNRYRKKGMPYEQPDFGMKIHYNLEEVTKWIGGQKYGR